LLSPLLSRVIKVQQLFIGPAIFNVNLKSASQKSMKTLTARQ
jgi:hypothetical protein